MKRYLVKRPKDTVEVLILPNKDGSGYQYLNLTKGHICPCKFKTELDALKDMDKKINEGKVIHYEEIKESKEKDRKITQLEMELTELKDRIKEMGSALERWYKQYSDKNYTETFYSELITDTEILLWSNACVK